jgi:glucosyl-dolichyl phosphate glucuronosyltransferase
MNESTISVVICAYTLDRWEHLAAAVASLEAQTLSPHEIIVVIDHNDDLFARAHAAFPGAMVLENTSQRGSSGARNVGVERSRGTLIAFLDDDAEPSPTWLEGLASHCRASGILGAGGAITPVWQGGRPRWFPEEFDWVIGCTYRGMPIAQSAVRNLFSSAMCMRRDAFFATGGFRLELARVGKHPTGTEETELCIKAAAAFPGEIFLFDPAITARHHVPISRATWRYYTARCFHEGRSKARMTRVVHTSVGLASERAYTLRTLPMGVRRGLADAFVRRDFSGFARATAIVVGLACTTWGYLLGRLAGA